MIFRSLSLAALSLAFGLLSVSTGAQAQSLGRARVAALIGQPLDMRIEARLDPAGDEPGGCVEADVLVGDLQLTPSRVLVSLDRGPGEAATIRIRTTVAVDEPLVTVFVRAGCQQKTTRRYVVLPEAASAVVPVTPAGASVPVAVVPAVIPPVAAPVLPASGAPQGAAQAGSALAPADARAARQARQARQGATASASADARAPQAPGADAPAARAERAARPRPPRPESAPAQAPSAATGLRSSTALSAPAAGARAQAQAAAKGAARPRLRLDPVDLLAELDPVLRATPEITTPVSESNPQRAAAAALWRALNARPEDILRDADRAAALQAQVELLRTQEVQSRQAIEGLKTQVQAARQERYANWLVYALALALLLAVAALVWALRRDGQVVWRASARRPWWKAQQRFAELDRFDDDSALPNRRATAARSASAKVTAPDDDDEDDAIDESLFESLKRFNKAEAPAAAAASAAEPLPRHALPPEKPLHMSDFSVSLPSMQRSVNAEELMDMQQQADFFMSLGQHDQAIAVLRNHINENVETSALAYLDLFRIYHQLGRREDYQRLTEEFTRVFSARIPGFDEFAEDSPGLEDYEAAMTRIQALWPSAKVLEVIEETIFRKPGREATSAFSLEAYRDLLMLYSIAKDMNEASAPMADLDFGGRAAAPAGSRESLAARVAPTDGVDSGMDDPPRSTRFAHTSMQPLPDVPAPAPSTPRTLPPLAFDATTPDAPLPGISLPELAVADAAPPALTPESAAMIDLDDLDALMNSVQPEALAQPPAAGVALRDPFQPPKSANIGLDIDLSSLVKPAHPTKSKGRAGEPEEHHRTLRIEPPSTSRIVEPTPTQIPPDAVNAPPVAPAADAGSAFDLFDEDSRFENSRNPRSRH